MNNSRTWRQLLGKLICNPQERQRIADLIGVKPVTLTRWSIQKSTPRLDRLRALLQVLPHHQEELSTLLAKDFPALAPQSQRPSPAELKVPSAFYHHLFHISATCSSEARKATICTVLLQTILDHLDPHRQGMAILLLLCVPPRDGQKVRSLYTAFARGNIPKEHQGEWHGAFFGAESQPGYALYTGHPVVMHYQDERNWLYPTHLFEVAECLVSSPLLSGDQTAGCLTITCTQEYPFTQEHLELIQAYTELLSIAFEANDFYTFEQIELELMPPPLFQQPYLAQFRQQVAQLLLRSAHQKQPITRPQAELSVWQTCEENLLYLALHPQLSSQPG